MRSIDIEKRATIKRLYTVEEAGHFLGVSHWTVRGLINDGSLRYCRIGRKLLVAIEDLNAYVDFLKDRQPQ